MLKVSLLPRLALQVKVTIGQRSRSYLLHPECVVDVPAAILVKIIQSDFYAMGNAKVQEVTTVEVSTPAICYRCHQQIVP